MPHLRRAAAVALLSTSLFASLLALAGPAGAADTERYVVRFTTGSNPDTEARRAGGRVHRVLRHVFPGAVMDLSSAAAQRLRTHPRVAALEPDFVATALATQSSPTWGLDRIDQRTRPLSGSYSYPAAGLGVRAYIVDTGIRAGHTDLSGRVRSGWTAFSDGRGTDDCNGHGTHVAGTVGGEQYGVAKDVALVAVRVLDCSGSGSYSGILAGLDWVMADHGAGVPAVLNMSLGGPASSTLDSAVQSVVNDGITVVVAAGNESKDACTVSPARAAAALTTGATDSSDRRASFSNYGTCLDMFAPGVSIKSAGTSSTTATVTMSGTSMASPHVAGAAAVLLALEPSLTPAGVASRLTSGATAGVVSSAGSGSVNRLLFSDPQTETAPVVSAAAPSAPTGVVASPVRKGAKVTWTLGSNGGSALTGHTVRVYNAAGYVGSVTVSGTTTAVKITGLGGGQQYSFSVVATNAVGSSPESARSNTITTRR